MYGDRLTPLFAVVTLPAGILTAMFVGLEAALIVFVVGWLLLVPASAILFGAGGPHGPEDVEEWMDVAERVDEWDREDTSSNEDPIEHLRERYAAGEIDEAELERRLDALLETEDLDADDEDAIERAIDRMDTERGERELERE